MDAIYADERKMECYVVAKAIDDGLVNTIQYDWLLEHMDGKYRKKKWRDYIVNYLLIFYCCRNMDTHCVIVNENDFKTDKHKDDNFLVIMNDGRIQWIRDNYKTNRTIEALTYVIDDPKFSIDNKTFGCFNLGTDEIKIQTAQRHPLDIYRTLAHEIVHYYQKQSGKEMSGETGSECENEANSKAGEILRKYTKTIMNHGY